MLHFGPAGGKLQTLALISVLTLGLRGKSGAYKEVMRDGKRFKMWVQDQAKRAEVGPG